MMATGLAASRGWWEVGWVGWVGVIGFAATLIGLYFTWAQARDAKDHATNAEVAAQAASSAIELTQRQLRSNQMLILVPQLRWIAQEIDTSIATNERDATRRNFDNWRWQASHVSGVLSDDRPVPRKALGALQESVTLATEATTALLKGEGRILDSCEQARASINAACNLLNAYVGQSANHAIPSEKEVGP